MIVGVSMVKDEIDVLPFTIWHMFDQGVDRVVIADNGSTDGTREMLAELAEISDRVTLVIDDEPAYYQARKMNALATRHVEIGQWVIPFDADEHWSGQFGYTLAGAIEVARADVLLAEVWDYLPQPGDDASEPDPFYRTSWRETRPERYPVVAYRQTRDAKLHMGNHGVDHPGRREGGLRVRHLQYRSFEQFARKLRNGKRVMELTDLDPSSCQHWREWGALDDAQLAEQWRNLTTQTMMYDPLRRNP
jgi:glycosyltransferase involved in cell wall biosynthesis